MPIFDVQTDVTGRALTARLYADRSDTSIESGIALTELAQAPQRYRGTTARTGWHQVGVFDGDVAVAYWDLFLSADHVAMGEDRPHALWPPGALAVEFSLPEPGTAQFAASVVCRSPAGALQPGVTVYCALVEVGDDDQTGTAWAAGPQAVVSNAQGVSVFLLPAQSGLTFRAWRGEGEGRLFGAASEGQQIEIPDLIG
jgi:hypothetical protein